MINTDAPAVCSEEVQAAVRASAAQLGLSTRAMVGAWAGLGHPVTPAHWN
jgi:hypothetical protein